MARHVGSACDMNTSIADLTAIVTGLGLLVTALGVTIGKIAQCLSDLRRMTARAHATARRTEVQQDKHFDELTDQIADIHAFLLRRTTTIDYRLDSIEKRVEHIEERNRTCDSRQKQSQPEQ